MLRKWVLAVVCCLVWMSADARLGIGAHFSPAEDIRLRSTKDGQQTASALGAELIWETEAEIDALGIRLGVDIAETHKLNFSSGSWTSGSADIYAWTVPLTVYYRYKVLPSLHLIGGVGIARTNVQWDIKSHHYGGSGHTEIDSFVFNSYFTLGAEWRPWDHFGIGAELRHILSGKTKINAPNTFAQSAGIYTQLEKTSVSVSARLYF